MPDIRSDPHASRQEPIRVRDRRAAKPLDRQMGDEQRHNAPPGELQFR